MENKKLKNIIIAIIISLLVIISIIIMIIVSLNIKENIEIPEEMTEEEYSEIFEEEPVRDPLEINSSEYIAVRDILQQYINSINFKNILYYERDESNQYIFITTEQEISKRIYDILSTDYIDKNNINEENVFNNINKLEESYLLSILEINKLSKNEKTKSFAVRALLQDMQDLSGVQVLYMIVHIDDYNLTYALEPVEVKSIDEIQLGKEIQEIKANDNNTFKYTALTDEDIIREYMNRYKRISMVSSEFVYENILNEEYRAKRFGSVEKFSKYIENNKDNIKSINIKKYQKNDNNSEYIQYVCIDQRVKYYIFRENYIVDYSLILDTYTIDLPEFIEKYDSASDTNKVSLNANKIVEAVNNQDYDYIYNKLDETYRKNNFVDVIQLEKYIKNAFYENTVIKDAQCKQEGNVYVFTMQITNYEGTAKLKDVTIIMQLLEDRNFVMSFAK